MVVIHKFTLWCAWCGDGAAVVGHRKLRAGLSKGDKAAAAMEAQHGDEDGHFEVGGSGVSLNNSKREEAIVVAPILAIRYYSVAFEVVRTGPGGIGKIVGLGHSHTIS
jgi:hypothetical protein